jgi:hypothetical protein
MDKHTKLDGYFFCRGRTVRSYQAVGMAQHEKESLIIQTFSKKIKQKRIPLTYLYEVV